MSSGPMSSGDRGDSRRWPAAALLAVVAAAVLAAGCGSPAGHITAGSSEHPTATPSVAGSSSSGIPTGTQLQALLPYHSGQPTGWKLDPAKFSTHNSGSALTLPEGLLPDSNSCVYIADTSGVNSLLQWWQVSFAQADMVREVPQANGGATTSFYAVEMLLAGFHPGYAARQLNWVIAHAKACPTYHDTANQALETTTYTVIPGLGDQAVFLSTRTKTAAQNLVDQELVVRVGDNVAGLAQNTSLGPLVSLAKLESMAKLLVQILQQHPTGS